MYIPKKISEKIVISNKYLKVAKKIFSEENWKKNSFLITSHNKKKSIWTFVLPITSNGEIIYLKEYRYWPEKIVINFPVGILENWISEIKNCKRELLEETWYDSDEIIYLWKSIIENYFEWEIKYYIAKNCKKSSKQKLDNWENIEVFKTSTENFENMILWWEVESSKTAYCFFLALKSGYITK